MTSPAARARELHLEVARALLATFRPRTDVYATRIDDQRDADRINERAAEHGKPARWAVGDWRPARRWVDGQAHDLPLTAEALADHVAGRRTIGLYPLRDDGTSCSVSVDFDDHRGAATIARDPRDDLDALIAVCLRRGLRFIANVSRGGRGCWAHFLLPDGTSAAKGRAVVGALVRDAGLRHIADGGTFDSLFPKQNDLRRRGPGNLFCAPINGRWLRAAPPGTHLINTDPTDLRAQLRALTEY